MEMWTEIRRKVLVEGASKRSILRDYGIGHQALDKILENPEPPGYQVAHPRPKPKLGPYLAVIDQILNDDRSAPVKQRHTARRIFERLRDEYGYTGGICKHRSNPAARTGRKRQHFGRETTLRSSLRPQAGWATWIAPAGSGPWRR